MGFANQTDAIATAVPYIGLRGYPRIGISNNISNSAGLVTKMPKTAPWTKSSENPVQLSYLLRDRGGHASYRDARLMKPWETGESPEHVMVLLPISIGAPFKFVCTK